MDYQIGEEVVTMRYSDIRLLQNEQARLLRTKGLSLGKIAEATGLTKGVVTNICRSCPLPVEDENLLDKMRNGEACKYCGEPLTQTSGLGRRRLFCGEHCRRSWWRIHRAEQVRKPEKVFIRTCAYCKKPFEVYGKTDRKYCCQEHYFEHRNLDQVARLISYREEMENHGSQGNAERQDAAC